MLARLGHFATSHPWRYLTVWLAVLAILAGAVISVGPAFTSSITAPASESSAGLDILSADFPGAGGDSGTIVFKAEQGVADPAVEAAMTELFEATKGIEGVVNIISPYSPIGANQISSNGESTGKVAYAQLVLDPDTTTDDGARIAEEIGAVSPDTAGLEIALGGDMFRHREPPNSEMLGLAFAIFVLILSFGSVMAMGLPIATALAGVGTGVLATVLLSNLVEMPDFAATIGIMIGLGVGIDYALFIVTRYQEHLRRGDPVSKAVAASLDTAGRAVLFAGITVVVSLLGMLLMGVTFITGLAVAAATTVLLTLVASVTLLPALIGLAGQRIQITRWSGLIGSLLVAVALVGVALDISALRLAAVLAVVVVIAGRFNGPLNNTINLTSNKPMQETSSFRWSRLVQRRAVIITVSATLALMIVALPVFSMQLGFADAGNDPEGKTTRRAYDLLEEGFGPGANGPLILVAELPSDANLMEVQAVAATLSQVEGVSQVSPGLPNDPAQPTAVVWQVTRGPASLTHCTASSTRSYCSRNCSNFLSTSARAFFDGCFRHEVTLPNSREGTGLAFSSDSTGGRLVRRDATVVGGNDWRFPPQPRTKRTIAELNDLAMESRPFASARTVMSSWFFMLPASRNTTGTSERFSPPRSDLSLRPPLPA